MCQTDKGQDGPAERKPIHAHQKALVEGIRRLSTGSMYVGQEDNGNLCATSPSIPPILKCGHCKHTDDDETGVPHLSLDMRHRDPILTFTCRHCGCEAQLKITTVDPQRPLNKRSNQ